MILNYVLLTAFLSLALGAASCTNEMDAVDDNISALSIKVKNQVVSRAPITETTLPADDKGVGITLVNKSDKGKYDGQDGYANTQWKTTDGTNWNIVGSTAPNLTGTDGVAVAYYPYSSTATDYTAITVESASQTDYMYSGWSNDLNNQAAEASFTMQHALAVIRVKLALGNNYTGDKTAKSVTISSDGFMATASLDAITGELSSKSGPGAEHTLDNLNLTLDTEGKDVDFLIIPADVPSEITFKATIGGKQYAASVTPDEAFGQGLIHTYTLSLSTLDMSISGFSVSAWEPGVTGLSTLRPTDKPETPWNRLSNGAYAISADGKPVKLKDADNTCVGVALVVNDTPIPQRLMLDFSGYLETFWGPATDNPNIPNYSTLDGTNAYGYLDGVAKPFITEDYKKWTAGALSDFNGKENSKYLDSSDTNYIGYKLKKQNEELEEGYNDWYIPSCGQMGLIYLYLNDINKILVSIGQSAKTISNVWEYYWTSTEYGQYDAYAFSFFHTKKVGSFDKDTDNFSYRYDAVTMFVRDIITEE